MIGSGRVRTLDSRMKYINLASVGKLFLIQWLLLTEIREKHSR